jgi:hypothetical protein
MQRVANSQCDMHTLLNATMVGQLKSCPHSHLYLQFGKVPEKLPFSHHCHGYHADEVCKATLQLNQVHQHAA